MTIQDQATAAIRTAAAALAAFIITWLANKGWDLPDDVDAQINVAVFLAVVAAYNLLANFLATHVSKWFGLLLIVPKQPAYEPAPAIRRGDAGESVLALVIGVLVVIVLIVLLLRLL